MGYLATTSTVCNTTVGVLALIMLTLYLCCQSWRPCFKISSLCCMSTYLMPAYIGVAGGLIAAFYLAPSEDETTSDQQAFISSIQSQGFGILAVHTLIMVPVRLCARRTISRWHGLIMCEIGKGCLSVMLIMGIDSLQPVASSSFTCFVAVALTCTFIPLIGRVATICKLYLEEGAFQLETFYQFYYGVLPAEQHPPLMPCEKSTVLVSSVELKEEPIDV